MTVGWKSEHVVVVFATHRECLALELALAVLFELASVGLSSIRGLVASNGLFQVRLHILALLAVQQAGRARAPLELVQLLLALVVDEHALEGPQHVAVLHGVPHGRVAVQALRHCCRHDAPTGVPHDMCAQVVLLH